MKRKILAVILCLCFAVPALAYVTMAGSSGGGTLNLVYAYDENPIESAPVRVYKIADVDFNRDSFDGRFTIGKNVYGTKATAEDRTFLLDIAAMPVSAEKAKIDNGSLKLKDYPQKFLKNGEIVSDSEQYRILADTFLVDVKYQKFEVVFDGESNSEGRVVIDGLTDGIYLVVSDNFASSDGQVYITAPQLVFVPGLDPDDPTQTKRVNDIEVFEKTEKGANPEFLEFRKSWESDKKAEKLDIALRASYLENGEQKEYYVYNNKGLYEFFEITPENFAKAKVTISDANNWKNVWKNLPVDKTYTWGIEEDGQETLRVSDGPKSTFTSDDRVGIIIEFSNKLDDNGESGDTTAPEESEDTTKPDNPVGPEETTKAPDETTEPGETTKGEEKESTTGAKEEERLPQTGQLWWPVPVLLTGGCATMIVGGIVRKKDSKKAEDDE